MSATDSGYTCRHCGNYWPFSLYVRMHWTSTLSHVCKACGAVHAIRNGDVRMVTPGDKAARLVPLDAPDAWQVSVWHAAATVPPEPGRYECFFTPQHIITCLWLGDGWGADVPRRVMIDTARMTKWRAKLTTERR